MVYNIAIPRFNLTVILVFLVHIFATAIFGQMSWFSGFFFAYECFGVLWRIVHVGRSGVMFFLMQVCFIRLLIGWLVGWLVKALVGC